MIERAIQVISAQTGVARKEFYSNRKTKRIADARALMSYAVWSLTALSLPEIGREVSKHHTTILKGIQRVRANPRLLAAAEAVTATLSQ